MKLYVHVGLPKTGTTFLQNYAYNDLIDGVYFPSVCGVEGSESHKIIADVLQGFECNITSEALIDSLSHQANSCSNDSEKNIFLISSEYLFAVSANTLYQFVHALIERTKCFTEYVVCCTVRYNHDYLLALYSEYLTLGNPCTLYDYYQIHANDSLFYYSKQLNELRLVFENSLSLVLHSKDNLINSIFGSDHKVRKPVDISTSIFIRPSINCLGSRTYNRILSANSIREIKAANDGWVTLYLRDMIIKRTSFFNGYVSINDLPILSRYHHQNNSEFIRYGFDILLRDLMTVKPQDTLIFVEDAVIEKEVANQITELLVFESINHRACLHGLR